MSDDYRPVLRPGSDPVVFFKFPGAGETGAIARGHIMAASIAHALRDGEVAVMGANSLVPMAGARLAQLTHAPNVAMIAGASGGVNSLLDPLAPSSADYANLVAEAVLSFPDVLMLQMGRKIDVFFAGGIQIDSRGNCNLAFVGPREKPTLRGPGSAGLPWAVRSCRTILYTTSHNRRVFVPHVDFVSLPGQAGAAGSSGVAVPGLVVTPLALLDFGPAGEMRLKSLHPGVTLQEVKDNTGFDLAVPEGDLPLTPDPTAEEMSHMRDFDPDGLLSIVVS